MSIIGQVDIATYQMEKKGNANCGDSYFYADTKNGFICAIADGLGSGIYAEESSQTVINVIKNNIDASEEDVILKCNEQLIGKRGVVLGILKMNFESNSYVFSSIGNISLIVVTENNKKVRNIPKGGYLGSYKQVLKQMKGMLQPNMNFIMYSDGVSDGELQKCRFLNIDVNCLIESLTNNWDMSRNDDTTLIALKYID